MHLENFAPILDPSNLLEFYKLDFFFKNKKLSQRNYGHFPTKTKLQWKEIFHSKIDTLVALCAKTLEIFFFCLLFFVLLKKHRPISETFRFIVKNKKGCELEPHWKILLILKRINHNFLLRWQLKLAFFFSLNNNWLEQTKMMIIWLLKNDENCSSNKCIRIEDSSFSNLMNIFSSMKTKSKTFDTSCFYIQ